MLRKKNNLKNQNQRIKTKDFFIKIIIIYKGWKKYKLIYNKIYHTKLMWRRNTKKALKNRLLLEKK